MRRLLTAAVLVAASVTGLVGMQTRTVPSRLYQPATRTFDIPPSAQRKFIGVTASFTRENWPAGVDYVIEDGTVVTNTALVVRFLKTTDDGATWTQVGACTFPGGVLIHRGEVVLQSSCGFGFFNTLPDGTLVPVAQDGDTRVEVINPVALRTAVTLQMLEAGDTP